MHYYIFLVLCSRCFVTQTPVKLYFKSIISIFIFLRYKKKSKFGEKYCDELVVLLVEQRYLIAAIQSIVSSRGLLIGGFYGVVSNQSFLAGGFQAASFNQLFLNGGFQPFVSNRWVLTCDGFLLVVSKWGFLIGGF